MVELAYKWAGGESFKKMSHCLFMHEGSFIKNILKLDNIITEFENAAMILQKVDLAAQLNRIHNYILRDIVNSESLYIQ